MMARISQYFRERTDQGTPLALVRLSHGACLFALCLMGLGCLVTERVEFEAQTGPLEVISLSPDALSQAPESPDSCRTGTSTSTGVSFSLRVADAFSATEPVVLWFVNGNGPLFAQVVKETVTPEDGTPGAEVYRSGYCYGYSDRADGGRDELDALGCIRIEAFAARTFEQLVPPTPAEGEGLAKVEWFLLADDSVSLNVCTEAASVLDLVEP